MPGYAAHSDWWGKYDRDFLTLGKLLGVDAIEKSKGCQKCRIPADGNPPKRGRVKRGNARDGLMLNITVTISQSNSIPCENDTTEATWHRYHGLRQANLRLHSISRATVAAPPPHCRTSSNANLGCVTYRHYWSDCPSPFRAHPFIAAAISCSCQDQPGLKLHPPDSSLKR
jgi:hypothetical protein